MMRILTVRQPWAWAIIHGGKNVENRVRNIAGDYRGPVAIHVAKTIAKVTYGQYGQVIAAGYDASADQRLGQIIGVVDLMDVHLCVGHCSTWALPTMQEPTQRDWFHLELANPRPLADRILYKGALGLRTLDLETEARVMEAIA